MTPLGPNSRGVHIKKDVLDAGVQANLDWVQSTLAVQQGRGMVKVVHLLNHSTTGIHAFRYDLLEEGRVQQYCCLFVMDMGESGVKVAHQEIEVVEPQLG